MLILSVCLVKYYRKRLIFLLFLSTMMIPFEVALIPNYITIDRLGLYDTLAALIVPWMANVFSIFILRQFFMAIPRDYFEAAQIDGCSHWRFMWQVATPMAAPALATITIFTFLGSWNNFIGAQIVLQTPEKMPLAVAINQLRGTYGTDYGLIMAGTVVSILPVLALFLLLQKASLSVLTSGAVTVLRTFASSIPARLELFGNKPCSTSITLQYR